MFLYRALLQLQPDIIVAKMKIILTPGDAALSEAVGSIPHSVSELEVTASEDTSVPTSMLTRYDSNWYMRYLLGSLQYYRRRYPVPKRPFVGGATRKQEIEEIVAQYWAPSWVCHFESLIAYRLFRVCVVYGISSYTTCCLNPAARPTLICA